MTALDEKLIQLLDALRSMLAQEELEDLLDTDTFMRLSDMEALVREWVQGQPSIPEPERVAMLARMTEELKPVFLNKTGEKVTLH